MHAAERRVRTLLPKASDGGDPRELGAMDLEVHLADGKLKTKYVRTMFDILAPGYDTFTRVFSFGMDRKWKRRLIEETARRAATKPVIVDLACGTGDLGCQLSRLLDARLAIGLDFSQKMLGETRLRLSRNGDRLRLAACDIQGLCLPDGCVDVVSIGYGLRNTVDPALSLREIARVLKPGGLVCNLDFYRPVGAAWRELFLWYMWHAGRLAGWLWHREPVTYGYIAPSIRRYWSMPEFEAALAQAGLRLEWRGSRLSGAVGIHVARREDFRP